ncbi:hypothetical protein CE143_02900 [Photorhabdus luminescens]|uniref:Uncharacterized protein n=1 Tax=Photorhabdus akhurstii TaxID=171438 RepID=A0ABX8LQM6_9GAMM|nr:hypothetical protein [Photorhabdus akhurstii]QXF32240.1 hypothetical protein B0X70_02915 [Photorhabdus akhurstii]UJD74032.1 hypothetical protein CE143_02900 [Photorhabdus luminescens]
MEWEKLQLYFSTARLARYLQESQGDKYQATQCYILNIKLSEYFIPVFSVIEISLRNSLNYSLQKFYQRCDWYESWKGDPIFKYLYAEIINVKNRIRSDDVNKIIAELTFGFWTILFNIKYEVLLWKSLRLAFPYCTKMLRKRKTISSSLNKIRRLRMIRQSKSEISQFFSSDNYSDIRG